MSPFSRIPTPLNRLLHPNVVASLGFTLIAVFGVLGVLTALQPGFGSGLFDLDGEIRLYGIFQGHARRIASYNVPVLFSTALSGLAALQAYSIGSQQGVHRVRWLVFTGVLAHVSLDEILQIHERLERLSGVSWQTLYVPLFILAAVVWWRVIRQLEPRARLLLGLGAAMWVVSQALEHFEWLADGAKTPHYNALMIAEEVLEMIGSLLFLLALLNARSALLPKRGNHERRIATKPKV